MLLPPGSDGVLGSEMGEAARGTAAPGDGDIHEAARKGNLAALRHCLRADPGSVGEKDRDGRSLKIS